MGRLLDVDWLKKKSLLQPSAKKNVLLFLQLKTTVVESSAKKTRATRPIRSAAFFAPRCCCCLIGQMQKKLARCKKKHAPPPINFHTIQFPASKNCSVRKNNVRLKQFDRIFRTAFAEVETRQPGFARQQSNDRRNNHGSKNRPECRGYSV